MLKKVNEFKVFCVANGIKQKVLCAKAGVGITSMHHLQNDGVATDKTVHKIVESINNDFGIRITFDELCEMIKA